MRERAGSSPVVRINFYIVLSWFDKSHRTQKAKAVSVFSEPLFVLSLVVFVSVFGGFWGACVSQNVSRFVSTGARSRVLALVILSRAIVGDIFKSVFN